jgi:hypothetical protein
MLTLEAGKASTAYSLSVFAKLDKDLGFDCYINGEQDILVNALDIYTIVFMIILYIMQSPFFLTIYISLHI